MTTQGHWIGSPSPRALEIAARLSAFLAEEYFPREADLYAEVAAGPTRWMPLALLEELKGKARAAGLWNLFLPESEYGAGLSNLEYAPLAEMMGRSHFAAEVFNCSAPDSGNMEVLVR
jgi:acyl-CoA dehydrogenase